MANKLLLICGSLRRASTNRALLAEAARMASEHAEFEPVWADLRLPLYDGDLEEAEGLPPSVLALGDQIREAAAIVISTPEYNKAPPGVLKNALDWASRIDRQLWAGKPVAILSATAGRAGGERAQNHLRLYLTPFWAHVLPGPEVLVAESHRAFNGDGRLTNERSARDLDALMKALAALTTR
ncbi:MAG: NAD(P)H-dependent oxidoreductase [Pseudomonadota bacterium]